MVHEKTRVTDCLLSKSDTIENQLNKNDFYEPLCGKLMNYVSMMPVPNIAKHPGLYYLMENATFCKRLTRFEISQLGTMVYPFARD